MPRRRSRAARRAAALRRIAVGRDRSRLVRGVPRRAPAPHRHRGEAPLPSESAGRRREPASHGGAVAPGSRSAGTPSRPHAHRGHRRGDSLHSRGTQQGRRGQDGVYDAGDRLLGGEREAVLEQLRSYPPVKLAPHFDGPGVPRRAEDALRAVSRGRAPRNETSDPL